MAATDPLDERTDLYRIHLEVGAALDVVVAGLTADGWTVVAVEERVDGPGAYTLVLTPRIPEQRTN